MTITTKNPLIVASAAITMLLGAQTAGHAQSTSWSNPGSSSASTTNKTYQPWQGNCAPDRGPEMSALLNTIIQDARQSRAASPDLLRDLRDLAQRYESEVTTDPYTPPTDTGNDPPKPLNAYFYDDFSDGNHDYNPTWRVISGAWYVDPNDGLRSSRSSQTQQGSQELTPQQLIQILLGGQAPAQQSTSVASNEAMIAIDTPVANSFDLRMKVKDHAQQGGLHMIMHQGNGQWRGYMLNIRSGTQNVVELTRRTSRGNVVIASGPMPYVQPGEEYDVNWRRSRKGRMKVFINGAKVFEIRDRTFRDNWVGMGLFNLGGDFSVREAQAIEYR